MKVPATLFMLLASQIATADFAERVEAGRAASSSPAARDYTMRVMLGTVAPILRSCAPPETISDQNWVLRLVGTVSRKGKIEDIEVEPENAITACVVTQMGKAAPLAPAAGVIEKKGFPLLIEMSMTNGAKSQPRNVGAVTPIFSQLVAFSLPPGFAPAFENTTATDYIQELIPPGESVEQWSQMITTTGARNQALNANATPINLAGQIAQRFQNACPDTFSSKALATVKVNGHDAFVAVLGCGAVRSGTPRSEVALIVAIKGKSDMYTIQWAERSAPINAAPGLDGAIWNARFRELNPVRVCNPVPGEAAPYPSCIDGTNPQ